MQSTISKLNMLKSVQPSEKWVVEARKEVLSKTPVFDLFERRRTNACSLSENAPKKSIFDLSLNNLFASRLAVSFTAVIFVLFGGFSASFASKSSLPGEMLYSVKMASEGMELAVASEDNKAEIEIKQAGKRLEEIKEISKRPSDIDQGEKLKQLVTSFEKKLNNAQNGLTKIGDNGKKAKTAKVINVQTEKYTKVLAEASGNLTVVVKNDVSEKFSSATDSNKKLNFDSLAVMIDGMTDDDKDEITAIVKGKVGKDTVLNEKGTSSDGVDLSPCSDNSVSETDQGATEEETPSEISDNIGDTEEVKTGQDSDISEDTAAKDTTIEKTKEELMSLLDNLNADSDTGEVKGDTVEEEIMPGIGDETTNDGKLTPVGI